MSLKDVWKNKVDGVDDVLAKDINDIAHQAIENENSIQNLNTKTQENAENIQDLSLKTQKNEASIIQLNTDLIINKEEIAEHESKIENLETLRIIPKVGGSLISLSDSAEAPLQGMRIFGKTKQATTTGKNKLPYPYVSTTQTNGGITATDNGDGSLTISGTGNGTAHYFKFANSIELEIGKTYTIDIGNKVSGIAYGLVVIRNDKTEYFTTFTYQDGDTISNVYMNINTTTQLNTTIYPIIVEGSTYDGNWEPYTGGMPSPSFSYKQDMKNDGDKGSIELFVKGGNLFGIDSSTLETVNYVDSQGNDCARKGIAIHLPAGVYACSCKRVTKNYASENLYVYSCINASSGKYVSSAYLYANTTAYSPTFTIKDGDILYIYDANATSTSAQALAVFNDLEIQLNPGAVAKPYEPYKPQSLTIPTPNGLPGVPVSSGGNYTDENGQQWICDEIDLERGVKVQRIDEHIFDGTEGWGIHSASSQNKNGINTFIWTNYLSPYDDTVYPQTSIAWSNHYLSDLGEGASTATHPSIIQQMVSAGKRTIYLREKYSTVNELMAELARRYAEGTPTIIKYYLPPTMWIETPLSEEEIEAYKALHTNYPNTTIYNDEGAYTEVKYVADTKNYVDNKIANEVAKLTAAIITE